MGLGTSERGNYATRLRIGTTTDAKGKPHAVVGVRCKEDTPGAKPVLKADGTHIANKKTGELLYRLEYDFIEGHITALAIAEDDYGKYLDVSIEDDAKYVLRLDRGDRYWTDFCKRLPNVRLAGRVRLTPYNFKNDEGKTVQGISILQDGAKIVSPWNKENGYEGGPPQAEFDEDEQEWKFGKRNRWFEENVIKEAIASIGGLALTKAPDAPAGNDEDDLPF